MKKYFYFILVLLFCGKTIYAQAIFSDDFSSGNLNGWQVFKYSSGLHGPAYDPVVVNGKTEITTRDQQVIYLMNGQTTWNNYTIEADMTLLQSLDDGYKGLRAVFYVNNMRYNQSGQVIFDGYDFSICGRDRNFYLYRVYSDGRQGFFLKSGSVSASIGTTYHFKIVVNGPNIKCYFGELLLADVNAPETGLNGGMFGFFGGDDRISVDNVVVYPSHPSPPGNDQEFTSDDNTILLLHFNETTGYRVLDASANGYDSDATSNTQIVSGKFGNSRRFGYYNGRSFIPYDLNIMTKLRDVMTADFTLEAYVYLDEIPSIDCSIIDFCDPYDQQGLRIAAGGYPAFKESLIGTTKGTVPLSVGVWNHVAAIGDNNSIKVYLNGTEVSSGIRHKFVPFSVMKIGDMITTNPIVYLKGRIDELRISNIVRYPSTTNKPPVVSANGPYTVGESSSVTLSATGSDPENSTLTYTWDLNCDSVFETSGKDVTFSASSINGPSVKKVKVKVTDAGGLSAISETNIYITNVAPVITQTLVPVTSGPRGTVISLNAVFIDPGIFDTHTASIDWGDGSITSGHVLEANGSGDISGNHLYNVVGNYTVRIVVADKDSGSGIGIYSPIKIYNRPPDISKSNPSNDNIWPLNKQFIPIEILGITDPDGDPINISITGIWQDEPVKSSGNSEPDGKIEGSKAWVRADRDGNGNGRVYHIFFNVSDGLDSGTVSGQVLIHIPKSQGNKGSAIDDGALYNSLLVPGGNNSMASSADKSNYAVAYPNPFNPSTTIIYNLKDDDFITIKVYNSIGQELNTLVNEQKTAGKYIVNFDASNLSSGIYYYTIKTSNNFQQHKMILVK